MKQGICHLSQIPLRSQPKSSAEMVSQLIYGETYDVLHQEGDWFKVKMHYDGYEGWMSDSSLFYNEKYKSKCIQSQLQYQNHNDIYHGQIISSMGSEFITIQEPSEDLYIEDLAKSFLGSPYLWGGRHYSGIDCSGFVQVLYKVLGKKLPRDASQQQKVGKTVSFGDLYMGDLVFFEKDYKIGHVGLYIGNGEIIHSHGCVRIDKLTKKGIINSESGAQTHHFHSAKRLS